MNTRPAQLLSLGALAVVVLASLLFFRGMIGHSAVKWAAVAGTVAWFLTAPTWIGAARNAVTDVDSRE